ASVNQTPRTATKETGESLTINCVVTGARCGLSRTSWFRKNPGTTDWERMSIGGRYVESVNKGAKSFSLRIKDLTVADSATYICRAWSDTSQKPCHAWEQKMWEGHVDGAGTVLTVNQASGAHHHHHHGAEFEQKLISEEDL
uniref:VNAR 3B4 n=1 Tax=Squalus acanthias TaxID=7797 RepID=UPI001E281B9E|nr:Chain C, VNAR 3B4 [Squalus acanthias]7SPO_D Chain D, VNAR 3B4 [Squalus acanthias]